MPSAGADIASLYGMTFKENETGLTLTDITDLPSDNTVVIIPDEVDGVPVTAIGSGAFISQRCLKCVVFGKNIQAVEESAFYQCSELQKVVMNDKLKTIGDSAFSGCSKLNDITVGSNIEYIGESAFLQCVNLNGFEIPDTVKHIDRAAFQKTRVKELVIPEGVTGLEGCPAEQTYGKNIDEPIVYNVTLKIMDPECKLSFKEKSNEWANCIIVSDSGAARDFAEENGIHHCGFEQFEKGDYKKNNISYFDGTSANYEYGMSFTKVDSGAKLAAAALSENGRLIIPDEIEGLPVVSVSKDVYDYFYHANYNGPFRLRSIKIGNNVKSIPKGAFTDSTLRIAKIGDGVETIGNSAFIFCEALSYVKFGKGIKEVGEEAFYHCRKMQSVIDLPSVIIIGDEAFICCKNAKGIILGNDLKTIGDSAFEDVCDYKVLDLPDSLESIGANAFEANYSLEEVRCGKGLKSIGKEAFSDNAILKKVTLNEVLTDLGESAFENCYLLHEINIPDSLTEIKDRTFYKTSINSLSLPENIKSVGKEAYCSLYLGKSLENKMSDPRFIEREITMPKPEGDISIKILNPDCEIGKDAFAGTFDYMYGYKGSTAEEYMINAKMQDRFIPLDEDQAERLAGDANCDGTIDLADAVIIMQALANPDKYGLNGTAEKHITLQGITNGDVDKTVTGITSNDALRIQEYLLGKDVTFD